MQYIFKNYRSFIRYNTPLFILSMGIIMVSVLLIHFIYGVYQNYNIIQSGDYDQVEGFDEFSFEFSSEKGKEVTKSDMDRCIKRISNKMDLIEGSGNSNFVVLIVYSPLNWNIPKGIESKDTSIKVAINRSGVSAPDIVFDNMQTYSFTDGSRWSDIQEKEGAQVTLFWNYKNPQYQIEGVHPEDAINADNTVTIEGKDYKIIGYQNYQIEPMIPYSSLDNNISFSSGTLTFPEHMSMTSYEILTNILKDELGDRVTFEYPGEPQKDTVHYVYNIVFIIVGLVTLIASIDLMSLYRFYLRKNHHKMAVFRLCGLSRWKNIFLQLGEFLILILPGYIIAILLFAHVLVPHLQPYYLYMPNSFSIPIYCILFGIYITCSVIFCLAITWNECRGSIIKTLN